MSHNDAPTRCAARLLLASALCATTLFSTHAAASQALAQKYACVACHQPAVKVVGPSWKDIRAKYADGKTSAAELAATVRAGSTGKWGGTPMPPQARVPDADLQTLAQWLLDDPRP